MTPAIRHILLNRARFDPRQLPNLAAWYDAGDVSRLTIDGSNRVSLFADKSGNSGRDLSQATVASQPVYLPWSGTNYAWPATSSGYSSPDDAKYDVVDLDIDFFTDRTDWTVNSSGSQVMAGKGVSAGNQRGFVFYRVSGTRNLRLRWSADGSTTIDATSGSVPAGTKGVRVTLDVDNGAGGYTARFWTTTDSVTVDSPTWSQLGADIVGGATTSIFANTDLFRVGLNADLGTWPFDVVRARMKASIGGANIADFNPALYTGGTTFTASTGEVWTINGGAAIVTRTGIYYDGANDFMRSAAFTLGQPCTRYLVLSQVSWTSGDYLVDGASAANTGALIQTTSTPQLNINAGSSVAANTGLAIKTVAIVTLEFNGASSSLAIDSIAATTGNAGTAAANGITQGASGASTPANFGNVVMHDDIIYSGTHDAATKARIRAYLRSRWGTAA